jgi:hypothetical protein
LTEHTTTECLLFPDIFDRPVVAKFDQRQGSSDGGAVLLNAANQRLGLTSALAACLKEERQPGKILHEIEELLTQRVMGTALGNGKEAFTCVVVPGAWIACDSHSIELRIEMAAWLSLSL